MKAIIEQRQKNPPHLSKKIPTHYQREKNCKVVLCQPTSSLQMIIRRNKENSQLIKKRRCNKTKGKQKPNNCKKVFLSNKEKKRNTQTSFSKTKGKFNQGTYYIVFQTLSIKIFLQTPPTSKATRKVSCHDISRSAITKGWYSSETWICLISPSRSIAWHPPLVKQWKQHWT